MVISFSYVTPLALVESPLDDCFQPLVLGCRRNLRHLDRSNYKIVGALTKKLDASGDGKVSLSEMSSVLDPKSKFPVIDKMLGNLVQRVDASKDGLIDNSEWSKSIGALDKNVDGLLSRPELHHGPDVLLALIGVIPHDPPPGG